MREFLEAHNAALVSAYALPLGLLREHYGIEQAVLAGGYGYRQILELVQNGADAILEENQEGVCSNGLHQIHLQLHGSYLYVANTGAPLSKEGLDALLSSHSSPKRGRQIGRFGLGFKSLLRLGGRIDLFTRSTGAIRFDPDRCRRELKARFNVTDAPGLRLAWPLEESERSEDSVLAQLAWAETIVRVEIQTPGDLEHLREEINAFPAEFLLFLPISIVLLLDDGGGESRELRFELDGDDRILHAATESRWRVTEREISITDKIALADATHIHARDSVPVAWAVPLDAKREEAGRFWAFFPTHTPTYLPGILNAPWKLNSDRNAIIGGEWNTALMAEAARLVAEMLPSLSAPDDFARPLDAFPRQLERRDEDAAPLVESLWTHLEDAPVIPDASGILRPAQQLFRHPRDSVELARQWQVLAGPDGLACMIHASCLERQRSSRLNMLAERLDNCSEEEQPAPCLRRRGTESWFEAIASITVPEAIQVLKLAEVFAKDCKHGEWDTISQSLAIIPSQSDQLRNAGQVIFAPTGVSIPNREAVASVLCENLEAKRILADVMRVKALDDSVWESVLREAIEIRDYNDVARDAGWRSFWEKLRMAPTTVQWAFADRNKDRIRVRRSDNAWVFADEVLFPGALVPPDDASPNRRLLADPQVHSGDYTLLTAIGVSEFPEGIVGPGKYRDIVGEKDPLLTWLGACRDTYQRTHQNRAMRDYLKPFDLTMPKGWTLLPQLNGVPRARLTKQFLAHISHGEFTKHLEFGHSTEARYAKIDVQHPLLWFVLRHGTVQISAETVALAVVVEKRNEPVLARIPELAHLLPALGALDGAVPKVSLLQGDIRNFWLKLIWTFATPSALAGDNLWELWASAARDGVVPDGVPTETGQISLSEIFVTTSQDLARRVRNLGHVVVTLDDTALSLWLRKGARNLSKLIEPVWSAVAGPAEMLASAVPELTDVLKPEVVRTARSQPVLELRLKIGEESDPIPCLMWETTLLLDAEQLSHRSRAQRIGLLIEEVAAAGWLNCSPVEALQHLGDARVDQLRAEVARGATLAERLLRAVGGRREPLLEALGGLGAMDFILRCTALQLSELTLAQFGPATLPVLKDTLAEEGLKPPSRWNTPEARTFVASIGFPEQFAASPETRREAEETISGPIELPTLHDFQEEVLEGIRVLVATGTARRRAIVSLPTGGGKTRVTVEAAVRLILAPEGVPRSVVWVAQTDELCEQAVQAFRQVWLNLGAQRTDLRIVRLWGGNPNPAIQDLDRPIVVVASIQTLNSRMGTDGLVWLRKPGLVVVDECHHAITPSYTNLLRWLDAEALRPGAPERDEPPMIGLSATPFRTDDEESQRLARRFDSRWFPPDQADLHERLRAQGVLAMADYVPLDSGIGLLAEELEQLAGLSEPWEGLDFEHILEAINRRLGRHTQRNERLVECIRESDEDSILFFANSVQHAEEMSARLNLDGSSAAAISGDTPTVARRYFLDRFQRGEIRVLCNHSVLSTGFDAPRTDMVFIARQVFSPVRYMQMVGRGLRGERNGGTARCRVVTVLDNLGRFRDRHPFHFCARFFQ